MTVTGYQFDKMRVTPAADGLVYDHLMHNKSSVVNDYKTELALTDLKNGSITLGAGAAVIKGRSVVVTEDLTLTPPDNATTTLCITIDLSKENSATGSEAEGTYVATNNQVSVNFVTGDVTQEDINDGGSIFMCKLATIVRAGTTITITKDVNFYTPFGFGPDDLAKLKEVYGGVVSAMMGPGNKYNWYLSRIKNVVFFNYTANIEYTRGQGNDGNFQGTSDYFMPIGYRLSSAENHWQVTGIGSDGENAFYKWVVVRDSKTDKNSLTPSRIPDVDPNTGVVTGLKWDFTGVKPQVIAGWYFTDDAPVKY